MTGNFLISASAGSGKTFALVAQYIKLLFSGARADEILAITFTKKASGEMKERILRALYDLAQGKTTEFYEHLAQNFSQEVLKNAPKIYENFLKSAQNDVKIQTIDSFFQNILMISGDFSEISVQKIPDRDVKNAFFAALDPENYEDFLNFCEQNETDFFKLFAFLYECGTDFLTEHDTLDAKDLSAQILAIKNEILLSCENISQKIRKFYTESGNKIQNPVKNQNFKEFLSSSLIWLEKGVSYRGFNKIFPDNEPFDALQILISQYFSLKNHQMLGIFAKFYKFFVHAREQICAKKNILDFPDITRRAYFAMQQGDMVFWLSSKLRHILIDEFQDTSALQYAILQPIISEFRAQAGRTLFFVGDEKQSIYGFRGGGGEVFARAREFCDEFVLPYNFRSAKEIVRLNNIIFAPIFPGFLQKMPPDPKNLQKIPGFVKIFSPVERPVHGDEESKNSATQQILKNVKNAVQCALSRGFLVHEIAILSFKNSDLAMIYDFLATQIPDVKFLLNATQKITQNMAVKGIIHCLKFAKTRENFHKKAALSIFARFDSEMLPGENSKFFFAGADPKTADFTDLFAYILTLARHFHTDDDAVYALAEHAQKFTFLDDFFDSLSNFSAHSPLDPDSVRLFSIHGAKGLEFPCVILCDRLSAARHTHEPFLFAGDGKIFYVQKNKENFCNNYARALETAKNARLCEKNNVAYVAMTRAKYALFVVPKHGGELDFVCRAREFL